MSRPIPVTVTTGLLCRGKRWWSTILRVVRAVLRELPELNEFHHQKPENVTLIGVSFDPMSNEDLAALKKKHGIGSVVTDSACARISFEQLICCRQPM